MYERKKKEKDLSKKSFVCCCGRKNESNEINRKIKRFYRNGVHENVHENTSFSKNIVLCTNVIRESCNNGSRKHFHHPPVYFFLLVYCYNHVSPNHSVARVHNCLENFILRLYLPFFIIETRVDYSRARGNKKKKKHTIMKIIMKSSLLTVLNASSSRFQALKGTGMLVYWNLWSHRKRTITHIFTINAKPRLVSVARHLV